MHRTIIRHGSFGKVTGGGKSRADGQGYLSWNLHLLALQILLTGYCVRRSSHPHIHTMPFPNILLNDGYTIPGIAFGCGSVNMHKDIHVYVEHALEEGFLHLDAGQSAQQ